VEGFEVALCEFRNRLGDALADEVCAALLLEYRVGGKQIGLVLSRLAESTRQKLALRQEAMARQAHVRLTARIVIAVPALTLVLLRLISPEYLAVYDPRTEALERRAFSRSRAVPPPRILSEVGLVSLIEACGRISPEIPLRGFTMATLIGLLASTGLRSGEVVRLDCGDVDLTNGVIVVRKTKFRKDRLVPVHPTTCAALRRYARERDAVFPTPKDEAFFLSSRGGRLSAAGLQSNFAKARKLAGLDDGRPLRPHDLRHRFAVTRLRLWHQQHADVQALLPLLATYLGHASYSDTAYYLTGSSDLLAIAAERAFLEGGAQ
jgi:integrase